MTVRPHGSLGLGQGHALIKGSHKSAITGRRTGEGKDVQEDSKGGDLSVVT